MNDFGELFNKFLIGKINQWNLTFVHTLAVMQKKLMVNETVSNNITAKAFAIHLFCG